jgi:hypothetical protein
LRLACVLKSGKDYGVKQARFLIDQLEQYAPFHDIVCLTDIEIPGVACLPLKFNWPSWWAKMELFRPDIEGDLLYFDLDTIIVKDISDVLAVDKLTIARDFYRDGVRREEGLQSCLMYLPEADRADVWAAWKPELIHHYKAQGVGDQAFLESLWMGKAQRWQDILPGQIVSYKVHCKTGTPQDARIVCYHGKPRPWQ